MRCARWTLTVVLAAACLAPTARAAGLVEIWQAATQNDKTLAVRNAAHAAAQPRRDQAAALWRPIVAFATSVNSGVAGRLAVTLAQPLYNPLRRAQQLQIGLSVDVAEVQWLADRQALMLHTAERYFDLVLAAQRRVTEVPIEQADQALLRADVLLDVR